MEDAQLVIYIVTGIAVTAAIILLVLYLGMRARKKYIAQQGQLEKIKAEKNQEILKAVIRTVEKERMRIARDLHDSVGASLSMIKFELSARAHDTGLQHETEENDILERIDHVVSDIRATCFHLYPANLEKYGLNAMLEDTVRTWKNQESVAISYSNSCPESAYGNIPDLKLNLFRVFGEALNNVMKHSSCSRLQVNVSRPDAKHVAIVITHDGEPFTNEDANQRSGKGLGLSSISSRLGLIGGTIEYAGAGKEQSVNIIAPFVYD